MRKLFFISVLLVFCTFAFAQVEDVAKEVLEAYKSRNVELLKKNASGILVMAISESYFEDKAIQDDLKAVDNWDGKIREIRYQSGNMMGQKIYMASIYFADVPDNKNELYIVVLSSLDKQKWVMFASGIASEKIEEFNKMSLTLSASEEKEKEKEKAAEVQRDAKKYSVEMANGETFDKVSEEKLIEGLNKLDDDNFFLILNNGDDFLQAAYSDKGFTVQYKESGKQLEAKDYFSKEKTIQIFKKYFGGAGDWKDGAEWITVEY